MDILIACEYSGVISQAFRDKGHNAWSCDLLDTEGDSRYHIKDDVMNHLNNGWHMVIAHPPCTRICVAGLYWLYKRNLWTDMIKACEFFNAFKGCADKVVIENPAPHRHALELIGKYDDIIHPWMFGDPWNKLTCLWLENVPPLMRTLVNPTRGNWHENNSSKERSRTFPGIARAMAEQWG